jgi:hypothetical protein
MTGNQESGADVLTVQNGNEAEWISLAKNLHTNRSIMK